MLELIIVGTVATVAWFWYTDRRNTQTAIKTSVGITFGTIKEVATAIKAEADIAKLHNAIADTETDRLEKFAERNAQRTVKNLMSDIGLDDTYKANKAAEIKALEQRLIAAKAKAAAKRQ